MGQSTAGEDRSSEGSRERDSELGTTALGSFIRARRQLSDMSLRQLATLSNVSNAYLSQIERGLHQPSFKVVQSIAEALNISTEYLLSQSGWLTSREGAAREPTGTEAAIQADPVLTEEEKQAVLGVYRSLRSRHEAP